jgi:gamma-glutamyltranspeptidase/glutathione hydrolase
MYAANNSPDNANHDGFLAIAVPGTVAGLYKAHQLYGSLPWAELLAPAIRLAKDGFLFTWALHNSITNAPVRERLQRYPSTLRVFYKADSSAYQPGEIWRQPDLASTLARIQKRGRDGFYGGKTARDLIRFLQEHDALISETDLSRYEAIQRDPVRASYRGFDVYAMSPPSSGGVVLTEMLNILEGYDLKDFGHNSARYLHLLTEVMRRAYADRARYLGDPDFNPNMPIDKLVSKAHGRKLRSGIDLSFASQSDSGSFNDVFESEQTTHLSVVDARGNAVSLTYTLEYSYGSGIVAEGLGFLLNNEMGDFNAMPGVTDRRGRIGTAANLIAPEKRMLSSMTPTIVAKDGKPLYVLGSPGGRTIINTVLQVILNLIDHDMNIAQAIEAGRIHHQWLPDRTRMEKGMFSPDTKNLYAGMGHTVVEGPYQGMVMGLAIDHQKGIVQGAADSRSPDGAAVGF